MAKWTKNKWKKSPPPPRLEKIYNPASLNWQHQLDAWQQNIKVVPIFMKNQKHIGTWPPFISILSSSQSLLHTLSSSLCLSPTSHIIRLTFWFHRPFT